MKHGEEALPGILTFHRKWSHTRGTLNIRLAGF